MQTESNQPPQHRDPDAPRKGRRMLLIMFGVVAGTYLAAWVFQPFALEYLGSTNNGEFVSPRVPAEAFTPEQEQPILQRGRWHLLIVPPANCIDACREAVHNVRQMQVLLGKDATRIRRVVVDRDGALAVREELQTTYPKLKFLDATATPQGITPAAYIVDPHGDLVLRYPYEDAHKPMLDDLKRMLKNSRSG